MNEIDFLQLVALRPLESGGAESARLATEDLRFF